MGRCMKLIVDWRGSINKHWKDYSLTKLTVRVSRYLKELAMQKNLLAVYTVLY